MNEFYCPAPWTGGYFTFREQAVCCADTKTPGSSPLTFMRSEQVQRIKKELMAGTPTGACLVCQQKEQQGFNTTRKSYIQNDPRLGIDWIKDIDAASIPQNIEVRFDNTCNFKCRMCGPDWSHLIGQELTANTDLKKWYRMVGSDDGRIEADQSFVEEILSMGPHLKQVYLTGGEPTISKPSMDFIDSLIDRGHAGNIVFQFATNTSVINPGFIEKLLCFKQARVIMSIDATGAVAEYQRHGTVWDRVNRNIERYLSYNQGPEGRILPTMHCVITAYTVLDIDNMMTYLFSLYDRYGIFGFGPTVVTANDRQPMILYSARRLGGQARKLAIEKLSRAEEICGRNQRYLQDSPWLDQRLAQISSLRHTLQNEAEDPDLWKEFSRYTRHLDLVRGESFEKTFGVPLADDLN